MNKAVLEQGDMKSKMAELLRDFEREKGDTFSITADMTRQYKAMQEDLLKRISTLENTIQELRDELGACVPRSPSRRPPPGGG